MSRPLIVLDVDDTLYLERDYVRSGFHAVADYVRVACGVDDLYERAWALYEDGVRGSTFDELRGGNPKLAKALSTAEMVEVYRRHEPQIDLEPDAREFLDRVHDHCDLAVVTDGPAQSQWSKVRALGLQRWITQIIVTDEHGDGWAKPSTRPFAHLQASFGAASGSCVYIADNPAKDFAGPAALGWHVIRVRRDHGLHADRELVGEVDATIASFSDQAELVDSVARLGTTPTPRGATSEASVGQP